MKAMYEKRILIPEDIAIVGFSDDIRAELMQSPLTTIRKNAYEVGKRAVKKLIQVINDQNGNVEHIIIKGELIIRRFYDC